MAINKVAIDGNALIDLSTDTVASANDIAVGKVGHLNDGTVVTGTHQGGSGVDFLSKINSSSAQYVFANSDFSELGEEFEFSFDNALTMSRFFQDAILPSKVIIKAPKTHSFAYFMQGSEGLEEIEVFFSESVTDMQRFASSSKAKKVILHGSTKNVTTFYQFGYNTNLIEIIGDLDLRSCTSCRYICSPNATTISFVPNTIKISNFVAVDALSRLNDNGILSVANGLNSDTTGSIALHSSIKTRLVQITGTVQQRTDDTGTYDFFTADEDGTVTLSDFITQNKGWTIA